MAATRLLCVALARVTGVSACTAQRSPPPRLKTRLAHRCCCLAGCLLAAPSHPIAAPLPGLSPYPTAVSAVPHAAGRDGPNTRQAAPSTPLPLHAPPSSFVAAPALVVAQPLIPSAILLINPYVMTRRLSAGRLFHSGCAYTPARRSERSNRHTSHRQAFD